MNFRIADTFTDSLARLNGDEQKAVKTTAFDLQTNPAHPSLQFHKLDKSKDKNFWSVRVNSDIRIIVHRNQRDLLLCYVDHHDKAYAWAERRKLETHPKTGAAQLVEIRERIQEVLVPVYVQTVLPTEPKPCLFQDFSDDELLSFGIPVQWIPDVRQANEDSLLALTDHLPAEAAEALLEIATGGRRPEVIQITSSVVETNEQDEALYSMAPMDPFEHPDAERRFRVITNVEELERALEFPWDKWTIFLHPEQRQLVERDYSGPARVSGSAGTGKTVVALHRAVYLARQYPDARILLTTFSDTLANSLRTKLKRLVSNEPRLAERIDVHAIDAVGVRLYTSNIAPLMLATDEMVRGLLADESAKIGGHKFSQHFLWTEWDQIVDAWQLGTWEAYRDVARLGRKTRLPETQRKLLWTIVESVQGHLKAQGLVTKAGLFSALATVVASSKNPPYDYAIADEAQDLSIPHLRFLAAISANRPDALFFAGDLGQRIFQQPYSWRSLGVDIRGRSRTLRVNYRTSHQIRSHADRLLGPEIADVDGNTEDRKGTVSVFNGPRPEVHRLRDIQSEIEMVARWMVQKAAADVAPHEFGVFVRSGAELTRARRAVDRAGFTFKILDDRVETTGGYVSISTMPLAKGLEFRAVVVMACDDEIIPLQKRIEIVGDEADLQEVYDTERQLLYVACTRARDFLLLTSVIPASEFLDDLKL